jgi:hypothetical protein
MAVYIDNMYETGLGDFGRMKMSHMIADTTDELVAMAKRIGVKPKWIQYPGTYNEHFDVCLSMRCRAVCFGAIEIHWRDYARMVHERMEGKPMTLPPGAVKSLF